MVYEWTAESWAPVAEVGQMPALPAPPELVPGAEVVPGYRLEARIGEGCTGEVWRAVGPGGVAVALKFVAVDRPGARQELHALGLMQGVRHANLVSLFGIWDLGTRVAIGMDLADGSLLDRFVAERRNGAVGLGFAELSDYFRQAARGIDFLHEARHRGADPGAPPSALVHRDIKPQNLLLVGPSVRVGDFGLVWPLAEGIDPPAPADDAFESQVTAYTAPELRRGRLSAAADQYALAASYYHLRGGRAPAGSVPDRPAADPAGAPIARIDLAMLPPAERPAVARALATDPDRRWPSCTAFVEALIAAAGPRAPRPGGPRLGRAAGLLGLAVLGFLALLRPSPREISLRAEPHASVLPTRLDEPGAPFEPEPALVDAAPAPVVEARIIAPAEGPVVEAAPERVEPPVVVAAPEPARASPSGPELRAGLRVRAEAARGRLAAGAEVARGALRAGIDSIFRPAPPVAATPLPAPEPMEPRTATIIVRLPSSKAELVVRGPVGRGNPDEWYGPRRVVHSPPLSEPRDYLVGAFWTDPDGRPLTRSVPLRAAPGRLYEVDLRAATPTATEVARPAAP